MGMMQQVNAVLTMTTTPVPTAETTVPATRTTTLKPGQTVVPVPGSGSLSVTTSPPGAFVYIDGVMKGVTPAMIPGLPSGDHSVSLVLDGYTPLKTNITIEAGKMSEYTTGLPAAPKTPGFGVIIALMSLGAIAAVLKIRKIGK
jgi:hypothetical protein